MHCLNADKTLLLNNEVKQTKTKKPEYFKNAIHQNDAKRPCLPQQTEKSLVLIKPSATVG